MFNNWINRHDVSRVLWGIRHGYFPLIFSRLTKGKFKRIEDAWKPRPTQPSSWFAIPAVRRHWNRLVSGDETVDFRQYFCQKYLHSQEGLRGLTLGCGEGQKVLQWAQTGHFERIDAFDLSGGRIEKANRIAREAGLDGCTAFQAGDIYRIELPANHYDVIFVEHALHHFSPLEPLMERICQWLKPDGYFVYDEYVGPSRFQWTQKQLRLANAIRAVIPETYRSHVIDGKTDKRVIRPSRFSMIMKDPSEAVESEKILPLTYQGFNVLEFRGYHGATLHLVLDGIAQHFLSEEEKASACLNLLISIDDYLAQSGQVQDDFAVVICQKKT